MKFKNLLLSFVLRVASCFSSFAVSQWVKIHSEQGTSSPLSIRISSFSSFNMYYEISIKYPKLVKSRQPRSVSRYDLRIFILFKNLLLSFVLRFELCFTSFAKKHHNGLKSILNSSFLGLDPAQKLESLYSEQGTPSSLSI